MKVYTMAVIVPGDQIPGDIHIAPGDSLSVVDGRHDHEEPLVLYDHTFTESARIEMAQMLVREEKK